MVQSVLLTTGDGEIVASGGRVNAVVSIEGIFEGDDELLHPASVIRRTNIPTHNMYELRLVSMRYLPFFLFSRLSGLFLW